MILQINFNLNVPVAEYQKIADSVAHAFLDVRGLRWKIWLLNPAAQEAGGIYLFDNQHICLYVRFRPASGERQC